ncbi:universal stress protein Slr1101-like [Hydra vulgaris]|uniref:Universal stress protein Slr1101-like n=1 Tax=Hydra vulgaris TaxID=6087 RepID=A0ABM4BMG6_HYDVU
MSSSNRTILLAVDQSKASLRAFNWYVENLHKSEDTLILAHIHQMPDLPNKFMLTEIPSVGLLENYKIKTISSYEKSKELLTSYENLCKEHQIISKVIFVENQDSPGHKICELVKENEVDIIITGKRGLSKFDRIFLGSTSDYIIHHAQIPVIVVPPESKNH